MSTTTKRGPGRPATKKAAPTSVPTSKKVEIKRNEVTSSIREYKTRKKTGAIYMMQQAGTTTFDKASGQVRELRYCPNEPSPWRDEQSSSARRQAVVFNDGVIFVRPDQPNLRDFLDFHPENTSNGGNLFSLVNNQKKAEIKIDQEFLEADAVTMVRDKDLNDLLAVAVSQGINVDRPVNEIKHDLLVFARKNPKRFIESFDNPVVEMKAKIRQASKFQIIKLEKDGVRWYDTNKLIVSVPSGKDPTDLFVRYCLTEDAVPVVQEIEKQLDR
jgi:hypothetical protein